MSTGSKPSIRKIALEATPETYEKLIEMGYIFISNYKPSKYWYRYYSIVNNEFFNTNTRYGRLHVIINNEFKIKKGN